MKNLIIILAVVLMGYACVDTQLTDALQEENEYLLSENDSLLFENDSLLFVINALDIEIDLLNEPFFLDYEITPSVGGFAITDNWSEWGAVLVGSLIVFGDNPVDNVGIRFTLRDSDRNFIASAVGYYTLERVQFAYFTEYPYQIEYVLYPNVIYYFYSSIEVLASPEGIRWGLTPFVALDTDRGM